MRSPRLSQLMVILGATLATAGWITAGCGFDGEGTGPSAADATGDTDVTPRTDGEATGDSGDAGDAGDAAALDDGGVYRQPTLLLWLDGADPAGNGTVPANGAPVAAWVDKARARSVVQPLAIRQPKFRASAIAGKPALSFDGLDDFLDIDLDINGSVLPDATFITVFQNNAGDTSAYAGVWGHDNGGWDRFLCSGGSAKLNGTSNGSGFTVLPGLTATSVPIIATIVMNAKVANQSFAYVNGTLAATFQGSTSSGTTHMSIGNLNGPAVFGTTWSFDGAVAQLLVYGSALADPVRQAIEARLRAEYLP